MPPDQSIDRGDLSRKLAVYTAICTFSASSGVLSQPPVNLLVVEP